MWVAPTLYEINSEVERIYFSRSVKACGLVLLQYKKMKLKGNKCLCSEINFQGIFPHMALTFMGKYVGWFCSSRVLNNPECMAEPFSTWQYPTYSFYFMREAPTHLSKTESMENKSKCNTKKSIKGGTKRITVTLFTKPFSHTFDKLNQTTGILARLGVCSPRCLPQSNTWLWSILLLNRC